MCLTLFSSSCETRFPAVFPTPRRNMGLFVQVLLQQSFQVTFVTQCVDLSGVYLFHHFCVNYDIQLRLTTLYMAVVIDAT